MIVIDILNSILVVVLSTYGAYLLWDNLTREVSFLLGKRRRVWYVTYKIYGELGQLGDGSLYASTNFPYLSRNYLDKLSRDIVEEVKKDPAGSLEVTRVEIVNIIKLQDEPVRKEKNAQKKSKNEGHSKPEAVGSIAEAKSGVEQKGN